MTGPCIVWRCNGAAFDSSGLCDRHQSAPSRAMSNAALHRAALADMLDAIEQRERDETRWHRSGAWQR